MKVGDTVRLVGAGQGDLKEFKEFIGLEGTIIQYHPDFEGQWPFVVRFEDENKKLVFAFNRDELELVL